MKKLYTLAFCGLALLMGGNLQGQSFEKGKHIVSGSMGFGNFAQAVFQTYQNFDDYDYTGTGPFFFKYEYGVEDQFGLGVNFAYIGANVSWSDDFFTVDPGVPLRQEIDWNSVSFLVRFNYHFGESDKFDPYVGAGLGYRTGNWTVSDNDPDFDHGASINSPFVLGFETTFGARYYFTPNIGAFGEVGFAKGLIQFGLSGAF